MGQLYFKLKVNIQLQIVRDRGKAYTTANKKKQVFFKRLALLSSLFLLVVSSWYTP